MIMLGGRLSFAHSNLLQGICQHSMAILKPLIQLGHQLQQGLSPETQVGRDANSLSSYLCRCPAFEQVGQKPVDVGH